MADVVIAVTGFHDGAPAGSFRVSWVAQESTTGLVASSETDVIYASNAGQINTAIINAAVSVYADLGITIAGGDKKHLLGGAV